MTYRELYAWLKSELADRENATQEIPWLIEIFSGQKFLEIDEDAEVKRPSFYEKAVKRLKARHPFQYVVGSQEFYGGVFLVNEAVLIPRFETELLVDIAVKWGAGRELKVLDLCTGSGCIVISLARHLKGKFLGTDISEAALKVAEKNGQLNGTNVTFMYSDLFFHIPKEETFDLITANPPYLTQQELTEIPLEVTHEPPMALDGGVNGLFAIERILREIVSRLNVGGLFLMEIGESQGEVLLKLAEKYQLAGSAVIKDLNGKDRIFRYQR